MLRHVYRRHHSSITSMC